MEMKKRRLLLPEREEMIIEALRSGAATVSQLSSKLRVSEATIRRDLDILEKDGKLNRVHGGALIARFPDYEPVFEEKESLRPDEKRHIAELAFKEIEKEDTIYRDGGSTVLSLAKMLKPELRLTVVTNSISAASELMDKGCRLIIVGGELRTLSRTLVGPLTEKIISGLHFDKAFLGTLAFSASSGISTTDPNEAFTKEIVMLRSDKVYVLADSSKLGCDSFATSGKLDDIDVLVTDSAAKADFVRAVVKSGIKVLK
jgi:DeoR/GlpR family transcriptional regulator of sugar metabolism